jgi:hypothetical protein
MNGSMANQWLSHQQANQNGGSNFALSTSPSSSSTSSTTSSSSSIQNNGFANYQNLINNHSGYDSLNGSHLYSSGHGYGSLISNNSGIHHGSSSLVSNQNKQTSFASNSSSGNSPSKAQLNALNSNDSSSSTSSSSSSSYENRLLNSANNGSKKDENMTMGERFFWIGLFYHL